MTKPDCSRRRPWLHAAAFAVPITTLIVALMVAWFTFGNRHVVFLYYHDMGPRVPDTSPFSPVTRSRYWMTGCVAGGAVLALTGVVTFVLGRLRHSYRPPAWGHTWLLCAAPLLFAIPMITMTTHSPTLPLWLAVLTTVTTLAGLALALIPGDLIAKAPLDAALLGCDGLALSLWLLVLPGLEYVTLWIARGRRAFLFMLLGLPVIGVMGLAVTSVLRVWLRRRMPSTLTLASAAVIVAYLGFPFLHHVLFTDGQFYITDMDNFFSRNVAVQGFTFLATGLLIWVTSQLRDDRNK